MKAALASTNGRNHTMSPRAMPLRMRDAPLEPLFTDFSKKLTENLSLQSDHNVDDSPGDDDHLFGAVALKLSGSSGIA